MGVLPKLIKDCLTVSNGDDFDVGRVAGCCGIAIFFALTIADFCIHQKFDAQSYGTGFGLMIAGLGAALMLKRHTEPQDKPPEGP